MTIAEPGWTMWMVSHFHYDPVWWSTQGQFLQTRLLLPGDNGQLPEVRTAFELVALHLDEARRDPDYKFVLAEIDYLKPHFDAHPEDRADLLDFIAAGRIELVGGSYNEPNTNLTCAESTIRNAVYGHGLPARRAGRRPAHRVDAGRVRLRPGLPGPDGGGRAGRVLVGARAVPPVGAGPHGGRQPADAVRRRVRVAVPGRHRAADQLHGQPLLGRAGAPSRPTDLARRRARRPTSSSCELAPVAATRNVLLPVGGDHVIPSRWATAIHRDWNAAVHVAAVRDRGAGRVLRRGHAAEARPAGEVWITPQTRDMNPVYTGKDVSYIDTKQAQRAAETAVLDGERLATLAWLAGARYPAASLDKAWRLLVFGAHHDAITGTEGDQVYLDLLAGWREAWQRGGDGPRRRGRPPGRAGRHRRPAAPADPADRARAWPSWCSTPCPGRGRAW